MQLARDAQGSGDRVMAENYLQHAEHYNRIIAAAQAQMPVQTPRDNRDDVDDDDEDGAFDAQPSVEQISVNDGTGPQPDINPVGGVATAEAGSSDGEQPRESRQANGNGNAADGEESGGQRRSRRQRRRDRSDREESSEDEAQTGEAVAAPASEEASAPASDATKDVSEPAE